MTQDTATLNVRTGGGTVSIIDIAGDVTPASEASLAGAYEQACNTGARGIVLNFSGLEYMNSGGIGLLVTLLVRANRQKQRLGAYGLNDHYRQIFELTRLDEAIAIHASETGAIAAVSG